MKPKVINTLNQTGWIRHAGTFNHFKVLWIFTFHNVLLNDKQTKNTREERRSTSKLLTPVKLSSSPITKNLGFFDDLNFMARLLKPIIHIGPKGTLRNQKRQNYKTWRITLFQQILLFLGSHQRSTMKSLIHNCNQQEEQIWWIDQLSRGQIWQPVGWKGNTTIEHKSHRSNIFSFISTSEPWSRPSASSNSSKIIPNSVGPYIQRNHITQHIPRASKPSQTA